jgi:hypothetical protein
MNILDMHLGQKVRAAAQIEAKGDEAGGQP